MQCGNWGSRRQGAATVNRFFVGGALKFTVASYFWLIHPSLSYSLLCSLKDKGSPYTRLPSVGFWSWSRYLAVSLQVTWVINPAVGCHYFSPGLQLRTQPLRGLLPIWLLDERMGVNSLPKTVTRQRRGCDLNPGLSAPEFSTLTTRLPSHLCSFVTKYFRSSCVAPPLPAASGATPLLVSYAPAVDPLALCGHVCRTDWLMGQIRQPVKKLTERTFPQNTRDGSDFARAPDAERSFPRSVGTIQPDDWAI